MNKVIFQMGMLAFCVAVVLFGIQEMSFVEMIARAFVVFVIVVSAIAGLLFVSASLLQKGHSSGTRHLRQEAASPRRQHEMGAPGGKSDTKGTIA